MRTVEDKLKSRQELKEAIQALKAQGKKIVFTNGCFDLLHPGHVRYLVKARAEGDVLVVALNSDRSVRRLKGPSRPIFPAGERAEVISGLGCVDLVTTFDEETPRSIIRELLPDVLVKGGDWPIEKIVGRKTVEANGGRVVSIDFEQEFSTSGIIERIRAQDEAPVPRN